MAFKYNRRYDYDSTVPDRAGAFSSLPEATDQGKDVKRKFLFDPKANKPAAPVTTVINREGLGKPADIEPQVNLDTSRPMDRWEQPNNGYATPAFTDTPKTDGAPSWTRSKIFGNMSTGDFVSMTAGLAQAISPNSREGRIGGFLTKTVDDEKKRLAVLADKEADVAKELRGYKHVEGQTDKKISADVGLARENRAFQSEEKQADRIDRRESDQNKMDFEARENRLKIGANYNLHALSEGSAASRHSESLNKQIELAKINSAEALETRRLTLAAQGKEMVTGEDGSVHIVDKGTSTATTVPGVKAKTKKQEMTPQDIIKGASKASQEAVKAGTDGDESYHKYIENMTGRTAIMNQKTGDVLYQDPESGKFYTALGKEVLLPTTKKKGAGDRVDKMLIPSH